MARDQQIKTSACASREPDLVLYHYGELADAERAAIKTHTQDCEGCRRYLAEIGSLLPLTAQVDDPPQAFWDEYSRELHRKLAGTERQSWWQTTTALLRSWAVPAIAAAAVAAVALTITLSKGFFQPKEIPPEDQSLMEVLPVAENLDFFSNMEILDTMDLLESLGGSGNGQA